MATKSIYNSVNIRSKSLAKGLVSALENAKGKKSAPVEYSRGVDEVKAEDIKKIFGDK